MHIDPAAALAPVPLARRIDAFVFTADFKQRVCIRMLMLTAMVTAVCNGLLYFGAWHGIFPWREVHFLAAASSLTTLGFYVMIRSGWNQRFDEPTLALPQTLLSQTLIAGAYMVTGPAHASSIIILPLVLVFGMFNMRKNQVRFVAFYTIILMGCVMGWKAYTDPVNYPPQLELIYFMLVGAVLPAISQLGLQLIGMRARIKRHKAALQKALAQLGELATRDDLTGLANRRRMSELLEEHAQRAARGGPNFSVAMVDLDHFKLINDTHGHAVGDEVLRAFAREAGYIMRNTDIIGRWGGEEFLMLLPETPDGDPAIGLARLRVHLATLQVSASAPELRMRFSAGLTHFNPGGSVAASVERADRALYAAKAGGRNQTISL
jgi:diguanylate cyclase (GGDEF)-like protein